MHKKIIGFILSFCMIFCFGGLAYAKNGTGQVEAHLHDLKGLCDNKAEVTIIPDDSTPYRAVMKGSTLTVYIGTTDNIFVTGQVLKYEVKSGSNKGETGKITIGKQEGNQGSEHDKGLNNYKCTYQKDSSGEVKPPCGGEGEKPPVDNPPTGSGSITPPTGDSGNTTPPEGDNGDINPPEGEGGGSEITPPEEGGGEVIPPDSGDKDPITPPEGGNGDPIIPPGGGGIIVIPPISDGDIITPIIPPEEEITPPTDEIVPSEEEEDVPSKIENTKIEEEDSDAYTPVKTGDMTGKTIWSIVFILSMLGLIGAFFYLYIRKRA